MHPIVVLEVDPGGGQEVEEGDLLHLLSPGQEPAAELPGIGGHQGTARLRPNGVVGDVAREASAGGALFGVGQVVPSPIRGAKVPDPRRRRLPHRLKACRGARRVGALEVVPVEPLAHVGQGENANEVWPAVPVGPDIIAVAGQSAQRLG
jgi:hypothetical protein